MKRLILSILACLLLAAAAMAFDGACQDGEPWQLAWMNPAVLGSGGGAGCSNIASQETGASGVIIGSTTVHYSAHEFVAPSSGVVHELQVMIKDSGDPIDNVYAAICTSDGGSPPAPTTTCTNADNNIVPMGGTAVWVAFNFAAGYSIVSGTSYFVRLYTSGSDDTSNRYIVSFYNTGSDQTSVSDSLASWTSTDQTSSIIYRITSCDDWVE